MKVVMEDTYEVNRIVAELSSKLEDLVYRVYTLEDSVAYLNAHIDEKKENWMTRYDMFGHDKRDKEERDAEIKAKNDAYFNRNKNKQSGFHGLTPKEKEAIKKGVQVVKKGAKKAGDATVSGAKKVASVVKPVAKKIAKTTGKVVDYGKHVTGTVIGKTERSVKRTAKKAAVLGRKAKFVGKLGWQAVKNFDKKMQERKKKPK